MNLVVPVSRADIGIAKIFFDTLLKLGPYEYPLYLVCSPAFRSAVDEFAAQVRPVFPRVEVWEFKFPDEGNSWPKGPNLWFSETALRVYKEQMITNAWYWCELDSTPIGRNWLSVLAREYYASQKRCFGGFRKEGVSGENYLVGTMVYPKDIWLSSSIRFAAGTTIPWDIYCRYEFLKEGASTSLIHHNWRTMNYRRDEAGRIVWDSADPQAASGMWGEGTVIVHGCKDGSLAKVLYFQDEPAPAEKPIEVPVIEPPAVPVSEPTLVDPPAPSSTPKLSEYRAEKKRARQKLVLT